MQQQGIWEDDLTREFNMKQEEVFQQQAEEKVQQQLKDDNVDLFSFIREPTVTIEAIQDLKPMLALENSQPTLALQYAADHNDSEDETDVEEPPPCPVHLM